MRKPSSSAFRPAGPQSIAEVWTTSGTSQRRRDGRPGFHGCLRPSWSAGGRCRRLSTARPRGDQHGGRNSLDLDLGRSWQAMASGIEVGRPGSRASSTRIRPSLGSLPVSATVAGKAPYWVQGKPSRRTRAGWPARIRSTAATGKYATTRGRPGGTTAPSPCPARTTVPGRTSADSPTRPETGARIFRCSTSYSSLRIVASATASSPTISACSMLQPGQLSPPVALLDQAVLFAAGCGQREHRAWARRLRPRPRLSGASLSRRHRAFSRARDLGLILGGPHASLCLKDQGPRLGPGLGPPFHAGCQRVLFCPDLLADRVPPGRQCTPAGRAVLRSPAAPLPRPARSARHPVDLAADLQSRLQHPAIHGGRQGMGRRLDLQSSPVVLPQNKTN